MRAIGFYFENDGSRDYQIFETAKALENFRDDCRERNKFSWHSLNSDAEIPAMIAIDAFQHINRKVLIAGLMKDNIALAQLQACYTRITGWNKAVENNEYYHDEKIPDNWHPEG